MTGGGAPGGPSIIQCLQAEKRFHLHVGDANATATGRFLNDTFVQLPKASEPHFIDFVLDYCLKNGINVVFPLVTMELFRFSEAIDVFEKNNESGGKLTAFEKDGFKFDAGPSLFTSPNLLHELFDLANEPIEAYFSYK